MTEIEFNRIFAEKVGCTVEEFKKKSERRNPDLDKYRVLLWDDNDWSLEEIVDESGFSTITLYYFSPLRMGFVQVAYYCKEAKKGGSD